MSQKTLRDREAKRLAQATQLVMMEGDLNSGNLNREPKPFIPAQSHVSSPTPYLASFGFRCPWCGRKKLSPDVEDSGPTRCWGPLCLD